MVAVSQPLSNEPIPAQPPVPLVVAWLQAVVLPLSVIRQKRNYLPVAFRSSGILVIGPRVYLYVVDYPVDKDYGCSIIIAKPPNGESYVAKKTRRGQKQCPKCSAWVKGTRAKDCPKCDYQFNGKHEAAPAPEPVAAEKKAEDTVTFEQLRAVTQTVRTIGGFARLNELLGLVKEVGGLRKMKGLLEAMSVPETDRHLASNRPAILKADPSPGPNARAFHLAYGPWPSSCCDAHWTHRAA